MGQNLISGRPDKEVKLTGRLRGALAPLLIAFPLSFEVEGDKGGEVDD